MPQPYPKHLKEAMFEIGKAPSVRPQLCVWGMSVITQYVSLEMSVSNLFTSLLGANPKPAITVLSVIKNSNIRSQALSAVACDTLSGETLDLFNLVLAQVEASDRERNRIAHWLWAVEKQLPDAVVLLDPRKVSAIQADTAVLRSRGNLKFSEAEDLAVRMKSAALVYKEADFKSALDVINRAFFLVTTFSILINLETDPGEKEKARKILLDAPEIKRKMPSSNNDA